MLGVVFFSRPLTDITGIFNLSVSGITIFNNRNYCFETKLPSDQDSNQKSNRDPGLKPDSNTNPIRTCIVRDSGSYVEYTQRIYNTAFIAYLCCIVCSTLFHFDFVMFSLHYCSSGTVIYFPAFLASSSTSILICTLLLSYSCPMRVKIMLKLCLQSSPFLSPLEHPLPLSLWCPSG